MNAHVIESRVGTEESKNKIILLFYRFMLFYQASFLTLLMRSKLQTRSGSYQGQGH